MGLYFDIRTPAYVSPPLYSFALCCKEYSRRHPDFGGTCWFFNQNGDVPHFGDNWTDAKNVVSQIAVALFSLVKLAGNKNIKILRRCCHHYKNRKLFLAPVLLRIGDGVAGLKIIENDLLLALSLMCRNFWLDTFFTLSRFRRKIPAFFH